MLPGLIPGTYELSTESKVVACEVSPELQGERLDRALTGLSGLSRSQIIQRVSAGDVTVNGVVVTKAGLKLRTGQKLALTVPPPPPSDAIPQDLPIDVIYEDEHILVVNKAADMVVHPSPGHDSGTLVNALVHRFSLAPDLGTADGRPRPGIVHRLDRGTSGLLVVARTVAARDVLSDRIARRDDFSRRYLAIIFGPKLADTGTWDTLHGRDPKHRRRFSARVREGRRAITHWKVIARARSAALIECTLQTGRTHQIRVHAADAGHPIAGDTLYAGRRAGVGTEGIALRKLDRQALHAWELAFSHPITGVEMTLRAPPPPDLSGSISAVFGVEVATALL